MFSSWRWILSQRSLADSIRKLIYHPEQTAAHRTPSSQLLMSTSTTLPTKPVVDASEKHDLAASAMSWRWIQSQRSLADSTGKLIYHPEQMAAPACSTPFCERYTGTAKVAVPRGGTVLRVFHRCYETHLNNHLRQEEDLNRSRATDVTSSPPL